MSNDTRRWRGRDGDFSPVQVAVFHAVLISGFLLVHFCVARLW